MTERAATWPGPIFAITLFTDDLAASIEFYRRVFDLEVQYEDPQSAVFAFPNILINLLDSAEAPGLVAPEPVAPATAGVRLQLTINVDDTDAVCRSLAQLGVELLGGPIDRPWGVRTATFRDPGGHVWEIASPI